MPLVFEDAGGGRGLTIARFKDLYGSECSVQTSSLATQDAIWLGQHRCEKCSEPTRMHLTRAIVVDLIAALQHFVETGDLPPISADPTVQK